MKHRKEAPLPGTEFVRLGARAILALLVAQSVAFGREEKKEERKKGEREQVRQEPKAKEQPRREGNRPGPSAEGRQAPFQPGHPGPFQPRTGPSQPTQPRFGSPQPAQVRPGGFQPGPGHPVNVQQAPVAPFGRTAPPAQGWRPPAAQVFQGRGGVEIHRGTDGGVRELRTPGGGVIYHGPSGFHRVEVARPGGRVVVAMHGGGYVQRPWNFHGQAYVQRTYVVGGVATPRIFRPWNYGGFQYQVYMPMHYYRPAFYTWAYRPWPRPVYYRWGWEGRPWFAYYGGYFTPYPSYPSPLFWLTDFVLATTLETAYLAHASVPAAYYGPQAPMPPDARQALSDEVHRQMDMEQDPQAAYSTASAPPPVFAPDGPRIFLVSTDTMAYAGDQEVPLAEGSILQIQSRPQAGAEFAEVRVLASRGSACPRGSYVFVRTLDLQEMENHLHATLDQGMDRIQSGQGLSSGFPEPPPQLMTRTNAAFASEVKADDEALDELDATLAEAEKTERANLPPGTQGTAPAPPASPAPAARPGTLTLGMTPDEVEAALGQPRNTVDLGSKLIYVYPNLKVTFTDGRVTDVQ